MNSKTEQITETSSHEIGYKTIPIQSSNGQVFTLHAKAACISRLIKDVIDIDYATEDKDDGDLHPANDGIIPTIELTNVGTECLQNVIKFMNHSVTEPMLPIKVPFEGESIQDVISPPWYVDFATGLELKMVHELVAAANYMDIEPLFGLMCLVVTVQLMGKSTDEIKDLLGIEELTETEEQRARENHQWLFQVN